MSIFYRRESEAAAERYVRGLLTEHPNKNYDTIASVVPGTSEQQLQGLLTDMIWDEENLNQQRINVMQRSGSEGKDFGFGISDLELRPMLN